MLAFELNQKLLVERTNIKLKKVFLRCCIVATVTCYIKTITRTCKCFKLLQLGIPVLLVSWDHMTNGVIVLNPSKYK